jgi:pimeloyl-ACP methyl ester carboxylesterase
LLKSAYICSVFINKTDMKTIYKSDAARAQILALYEAKQRACGMPAESVYVETFAGRTHLLVCGDRSNPPLMLLHGINAGAPMALEAMKGLEESYCIYAVDSIGQAGKSAENRLPLNDLSHGRWLSEVMEGIGFNRMPVIGVSYGAYLLNNLLQYKPECVSRVIYVVPSGFVNGAPWPSLVRVSVPLLRFYLTRREADLIRFMDAFYTTKDEYSVNFQKAVLTGVHMDFRRPPLLKDEAVSKLATPVYAILAGDDVFFPGDQTLKRIQSMFSGFRDAAVMPHAKHIPDASDHAFIAAKIGAWLVEPS